MVLLKGRSKTIINKIGDLLPPVILAVNIMSAFLSMSRYGDLNWRSNMWIKIQYQLCLNNTIFYKNSLLTFSLNVDGLHKCNSYAS